MAKRRPTLVGKIKTEVDQVSTEVFRKRLRKLARDIVLEAETLCVSHALPLSVHENGGEVMSPESSAIRSLLTESIVSGLRFECAMASLKRFSELMG